MLALALVHIPRPSFYFIAAMAPKSKAAAAPKAAETKKAAPKSEPKKAEEPKAEVAEDKKRKAEEAPVEEPAAKKEVKEETVEEEKDAPADKRPKFGGVVGFNATDTTLNVVTAAAGKVLMSINEGGMQYLVAGARANVGLKAGRYLFEVKIIEALNPAEISNGPRGKVPVPRQLVRVGFSTAKSSLVLGDGDGGIYFDSEGSFGAGKTRKHASQRFSRDQVIAVLLNLDSRSPNANTISLFRDGVRIAKPQPLPEELKGETLFPHISFRNVSVQVNFGPSPARALPFKCRAVSDAAKDDTEVAQSTPPKDGKYEVVVPVAFPDEGTFDWIDEFLAQNPGYVELSDRALQNWAASSGLPKPRGGFGASNDKPSFSYGVPSMDDMSLQKVVSTLAPITPRNYVIMEVKSNLVKAERTAVLKKFSSSAFKKVARVVMGKPKAEYIKKQHAKIIAAKQEKLTLEWTSKKAMQERRKAALKHQKEQAELKKQAEEKRKLALEEAQKKKAAEDAAKKVEEEGAEKKEEETKEEETKAEEVKEEVKEEPRAEVQEEVFEDLGDEPPQAELTDEEKSLFFRPKVGTGDIAPAVLNKVFASFSIPEADEGFDDIKYEWEQAVKAKEYLRKWVLEAKLTSRIEDLQPSQYFKEKQAAWTKLCLDWQSKQKTFKATGKKKEPAKEGEEPKEAKLDIFSVEDVNDIGEGEPLYANFGPEDWALLQLRHELRLLQDAYKHDVNDEDRVAIPENHLGFYYNRYYSKQLNPKIFGLSTEAELVNLVKDTAVLDSGKLSIQIEEDIDNSAILLKHTEGDRRERKRRIDAGDETAKLKFTAPAVTANTPPAPRPAAAAHTKGAPQKGFGKGGWKGGKW